MTSEIRTNSLTSRAGLSTVTLTDSGPMFSGITTFVDNSGFTFGVGAGSSIFSPATNTLTFGTNNTEKVRVNTNGITVTGNVTVSANINVAGYSENHFAPLNNSAVDLGFSNKKWRNVYATTLYGDGSNLTGITQTTINSNTNNYVVTATGTANTLQGEAGLTYDGSELIVRGSDAVTGSGGTRTISLRGGDANNEFVNLSFDTGAGGPLAVISGIADATGVYPNTTGSLTFNTQVGSGIFERLRITSAGRVLIGTSDEGHGNADDLTIATTGGSLGHTGITIRSGTSNDGNIFFSDATSGSGETIGGIKYKHGGASSNPETLNLIANGLTRATVGATYLYVDDGTNGRVTLQPDGTSTNQILSTTTGFGSYCDMSYQAAAHIFRYGGTQTFKINADGTFQGKPDQINGRDTNSVIAGKSFKYTTSNISPSWGSGSNGWYSFYHMSDGVYTFWLHTGAHSSICFTASNGYDNSNKSFINVHHFINNANGNYGNVKGIRITNDGIVQVYLHASAQNLYFEMYVQVTCGDITNMSNLYATLTKETGSPSINDSWGTSDAYSPARGAHTTDGVCSPRILHNRREMSCFATSTSLYGANTSGSKGFYWDPDTASCQSAQPRNTGWSSYYINKHDGNGGSENRYIDFWLNNGQQGNITISGSGLNYGSNSDYRLKKDEVVMTDGIARVKQLRPLKFKWIKDNIDDEGFFAHEAQAVVPIAVDGTKDQVVLQSEVDAGSQRENKSAGDPIYQTMDNSKLVPVLTASIKELITKVETLEQENIALRARVTNLEGN